MANLFEVRKESPDGKEISLSDLNRLLEARTDGALQGFIRDYSLDNRSLFGLQGEGVGFEYETTVNDCKSMQALIAAGMLLCKYIKDPLLIYEDPGLWNASLSASDLGDYESGQYGMRWNISLFGGEEAKEFLLEGMLSAPLNHPMLKTGKPNGNLESLTLCGYKVTDQIEDSVCSLFDGLSKIMLHDLATTIRLSKIVVTPCSLASSLWLTFLETLRTGEIINCEECGSPAFALPKRRNRRRFCSPACRQKHFRKKQKRVE